MSDKKIIIMSGAAGIALLLFWGKKRTVNSSMPVSSRPVGSSVKNPSQNNMYFPSQNFSTPGVLVYNPKFSQVQPPNTYFNTLNVEIDPALSMLSDKYIPLFGFVGITTGGEAPKPPPIYVTNKYTIGNYSTQSIPTKRKCNGLYAPGKTWGPDGWCFYSTATSGYHEPY